MLIVDAHEDLAFNILADGRNYLESAYTTRAIEAGGNLADSNGICMLGLPEWLQARVAVIFATLTAIPRSRAHIGEPSYAVIEAAYQQAIAQLNIYRHWAASHPQISLITHQHHLRHVLASWDVPSLPTADQRQIGLVLLIENADLIRTVDEVSFWHENGVRIIGPAWDNNRYTASSNAPGSLTDLGRRLLIEMQRFDMILDISHMADEACLEVFERYQGPIIASHANPRRMVPIYRSLSDEIMRRLIARDGVIGIMPVNWALDSAWKEKTKANIHIDSVVDAIDIVCQLAGDAQHVGIGTDFDGGQGAECSPSELDTIADLPIIADALSDRGYPVDAITNIMGGNWQRLLHKHLPD